MNNSWRMPRGFGLVEAIVGSAILTVVLLSLINFLFTAKQASRLTETSTQADYLLEEGVENLKLFRDMSYTNNILMVPTSTSRYFAWNNASSTWATTTIDDLIDDTFDRKYFFTDVKRDGNHDITTSGGTYDPNTRLATVSVSWLSGVTGAGLLTPLSPAYVAMGDTPYASSNAVVISPDGKHLYTAANKNSREYVFVYTRDLNTGLLTKAYEVDTGAASASGGYAVAVTPDGGSVYVVNPTSNTVLQYARNQSTGGLSAIGSGYVSAGTNPRYIVVSPDSAYVYVSNYSGGGISQYGRDLSTGALTPLSPATVAGGTCLDDMSISSDGTSLYLGNTCSPNTLMQYSRNVTTGQLTSLGAVGGAGNKATGSDVSSDGNFVYTLTRIDATHNYVLMYSRDPVTSYLTALAPQTVDTGDTPFKIKLSPDGFFAYAANYEAHTVTQYSRNVTTGILTPLNPPSVTLPGVNVRGLAISPDGNFLYASGFYGNAIYQYRRNPGTTSRTIQAYITNIYGN